MVYLGRYSVHLCGTKRGSRSATRGNRLIARPSISENVYRDNHIFIRKLTPRESTFKDELIVRHIQTVGHKRRNRAGCMGYKSRYSRRARSIKIPGNYTTIGTTFDTYADNAYRMMDNFYTSLNVRKNVSL